MKLETFRSMHGTAIMRQIIHLDMDAFYASVEMIDRPDLKGKAVIVGGNSMRGVVSAASYEARRYGVHSAMPIATARRLCPHGIFLPVRMKRYQEISRQIMAIFREITPLVEPLSVDEAFLDVTACQALYGAAAEIAVAIKNRILSSTGLTASAGVATSKLLAKIASDLQKPDGLVIVLPGTEEAFLEKLPIGKLWGVGKVTRQELHQLGIKTIGDIRRLSLPFLENRFGKLGRHLYLTSRGIDNRQVETQRQTKSVGSEETFDSDLVHLEEIRRELLALAHEVAGRLRKYGLRGRTVTLKVKYYDFKQITRAVSLRQATDDQKALYEAACALLQKTKAGTIPIRLVGISVSGFEDDCRAQLLLFDSEGNTLKHSRLNRAIDQIAARFGNRALQPASLVDENDERNSP
jgi:DNA polymerase-4